MKFSEVAGFGGAVMDQVLGVKLSDPSSSLVSVENENGRVEYGTWVIMWVCGMHGVKWSTEAAEEEDAQTW